MNRMFLYCFDRNFIGTRFNRCVNPSEGVKSSLRIAGASAASRPGAKPGPGSIFRFFAWFGPAGSHCIAIAELWVAIGKSVSASPGGARASNVQLVVSTEQGWTNGGVSVLSKAAPLAFSEKFPEADAQQSEKPNS